MTDSWPTFEPSGVAWPIAELRADLDLEGRGLCLEDDVDDLGPVQVGYLKTAPVGLVVFRRRAAPYGRGTTVDVDAESNFQDALAAITRILELRPTDFLWRTDMVTSSARPKEPARPR